MAIIRMHGMVSSKGRGSPGGDGLLIFISQQRGEEAGRCASSDIAANGYSSGGRLRDPDGEQDVDAPKPKREIVLRMRASGAMFSVSCAGLTLGGCRW